MTDARCGTCRFFSIHSDPELGFCHRYPPKQLEGDDWGHPLTTDDDWCGEWQATQEEE